MLFGLRARVVANLLAAVSVSFGAIALTSLALVRSELRTAGERRAESLAEMVADEVASCPDDACVGAALKRGERVSGGKAELAAWPCCGATLLRFDALPSGLGYVVERAAGGRVLTLRVPASELLLQLSGAQDRLLLLLAGESLLVVLLGMLLFERGLVKPIARLNEALGRAEQLELDAPMLMGGSGDEIGRIGGTLRRMIEKIREDKLQREAYIAELEKANRELVSTREGLVRSEKLATVGRLAAGVAHEIGNPVAAILGYVGIAKKKPSEEYFERIEREVQRVDRILRDLLDFARPQPARLGPVSVAGVVGQAARLVEPQPRWRSMKLVTELPDALPVVLAQEHHATQVLVNLLINAADACGGSGTVRISAQAQADVVEVRVTDDGPGIRAEDLPRLFDPFFTTKPPGEGTGLGLAISHRLMESFGGSIHAESTEKGALFVLRFRRAGSREESASA